MHQQTPAVTMRQTWGCAGTSSSGAGEELGHAGPREGGTSRVNCALCPSATTPRLLCASLTVMELQVTVRWHSHTGEMLTWTKTF